MTPILSPTFRRDFPVAFVALALRKVSVQSIIGATDNREALPSKGFPCHVGFSSRSVMNDFASSAFPERRFPASVPRVGDSGKAWGTVGTISERPRADGTIAYRAEIVIRQDGKRRKFTATFDRLVAAERWVKRREAELRRPGGLDPAPQRHTLADAIDKHTADVARIGKTKAQVLRALKSRAIATKDAEDITSADLVDLARELGEEMQPQTVGNYMAHLSSVFSTAKPAHGIPLDRDAMRDALIVCKRLGLTSKSLKRDRRPSVDEMNALMEHFTDREARVEMMPMRRIIAFAMFSSRRQEEITRLAWADYEPQHSRILVRDMKHPGEKRGNDVWTELPPEAQRIIDAMPRDGALIFPINHKTAGANFTRACKVLGIDDLHFHDLRHEAASRLFEAGRTIPQVASVTGHRSWASLQRYSHLRATGDKWKDWEWLDKIT